MELTKLQSILSIARTRILLAKQCVKGTAGSVDHQQKLNIQPQALLRSTVSVWHQAERLCTSLLSSSEGTSTKEAMAALETGDRVDLLSSSTSILAIPISEFSPTHGTWAALTFSRQLKICALKSSLQSDLFFPDLAEVELPSDILNPRLNPGLSNCSLLGSFQSLLSAPREFFIDSKEGLSSGVKVGRWIKNEEKVWLCYNRPSSCFGFFVCIGVWVAVKYNKEHFAGGRLEQLPQT